MHATDLQRVQRVHAARWLLHPNEIELGRVGLHDRVGELWGMGWSAELLYDVGGPPLSCAALLLSAREGRGPGSPLLNDNPQGVTLLSITRMHAGYRLPAKRISQHTYKSRDKHTV